MLLVLTRLSPGGPRDDISHFRYNNLSVLTVMEALRGPHAPGFGYSSHFRLRAPAACCRGTICLAAALLTGLDESPDGPPRPERFAEAEPNVRSKGPRGPGDSCDYSRRGVSRPGDTRATAGEEQTN